MSTVSPVTKAGSGIDEPLVGIDERAALRAFFVGDDPS